MAIESKIVEDAIILIHQMKNEFLFSYPDHCRLANEVISMLRLHGPRIEKNRDVLGIVNFQMIRFSVCIPEEHENSELAEKFKDLTQTLCNSYDGKLVSDM